MPSEKSTRLLRPGSLASVLMIAKRPLVVRIALLVTLHASKSLIMSECHLREQRITFGACACRAARPRGSYRRGCLLRGRRRLLIGVGLLLLLFRAVEAR